MGEVRITCFEGKGVEKLFEMLEPFNVNDKKSFIEEMYDVDNIFKFLNFPSRINKYLNSIYTINFWGELLAGFRFDFELPLFQLWHYKKIREGYKLEFMEVNEEERDYKKLQDAYTRQFLTTFFSFIEKIKCAYANIYCFNGDDFRQKQEFKLNNKILLDLEIKDKVLANLMSFKEFLLSEEVSLLRKMRGQEVHNIGGINGQTLLLARSDLDDFRDLKVIWSGLSEKRFFELLKNILKQLDDFCTKFNEINFEFFKLLIVDDSFAGREMIDL